ncbi:hypothetical protein [Pedobacter miscanthi]|uniref:hypothetical protein n=1 Tax=Pedobacter miscanthi TaxID=2259170 RepID=UPI00292DC665|nr:hypothetical protein [Pedobacter miscanthi]
MNDKIKLVMNGYVSLTDSEKLELKNLIKEYDNKGGLEQLYENRNLDGEVKRIVGPTSSNACTCCGR